MREAPSNAPLQSPFLVPVARFPLSSYHSSPSPAHPTCPPANASGSICRRAPRIAPARSSPSPRRESSTNRAACTSAYAARHLRVKASPGRARLRSRLHLRPACHVWLWNCLRFPKPSLSQTPWLRCLRVRGSACTSSACRASLSRPAKVRGRALGHRRRVSRTRAAGGRVRRRCAFDVARKRRDPLALLQCHHIVIRRRIVKPFKTIHVSLSLPIVYHFHGIKRRLVCSPASGRHRPPDSTVHLNLKPTHTPYPYPLLP